MASTLNLPALPLFHLFFSFLLVSALHAAPPKEALLIANGKYAHFAGLAHPEPDAAKLSAALEQLGFRVRVVRDGNREEMLEAISEFERGLRNTGAVAFFHYGGHGVQVDGKNYLLPADADIPDERRVATRAVALEEVMTAMDAAAARASIIVIDACRDNPLPAGSGRNLARGLSVVGMKPKNSIVIYAAEAGSKALDGLFTPILAVALQQKGRTIDQVMKSVRSEVYAKSSGQQTPGEYNQLFEELFLGEPVGAKESPEAIFAAKPAPTPNAAIKPAAESKDNMVLVEGGALPPASEMEGNMVDSFYIGRTEVTWLEWKKARNWATEHGYDIGDAGLANGNDYPVQDVNWYDCVKWCNALSEMRGLTPVYQSKGEVYRKGEFGPEGSSAITQAANANAYRLPTEAEWEWAARGGVNSRSYKYCGSDDLNSVGWYIDNSAGRLNPVAKKNTNEIGLYDMSGNLYEWCWDLSKPLKRTVRGGSANGYPEACAVDYRHPDGGTPPNGRSPAIGLRIARSILKKDEEGKPTSINEENAKNVLSISPNNKEAEQVNKIPNDLNDLAGAYAEATAYFELAVEAIEKSEKKIPKFKQARDYAMAISLALAAVGRANEMAVNVTNSRIAFYKNKMLQEIDNRNENIAVLVNKYSQSSIQLVNSPSEKVIEALDAFAKREKSK